LHLRCTVCIGILSSVIYRNGLYSFVCVRLVLFSWDISVELNPRLSLQKQHSTRRMSLLLANWT
jgi:hypothetical protein